MGREGDVFLTTSIADKENDTSPIASPVDKKVMHLMGLAMAGYALIFPWVLDGQEMVEMLSRYLPDRQVSIRMALSWLLADAYR